MSVAVAASAFEPVPITLTSTTNQVTQTSSTSGGVTTYTIVTSGNDPYTISGTVGKLLSGNYATISFEYNCVSGVNNLEIFFSPIAGGRSESYGTLPMTGASEWKTFTCNIANARQSFSWGYASTDFLRFDWGSKSGVTLNIRNLKITTEAAWDTYSDTWVAWDELGREVANSDNGAASTTVNNNTYIGMFYYMLHGQHGPEVRDITKLINANPSNPAFGYENQIHWWGEPALGYYASGNVYIVAKHMQMLVDAGVDFYFFDVTNGYTYTSQVQVVMNEIDRRTALGLKSPRLVFCLNTNAGATLQTLWDNFYSNAAYNKYWFIWNNKPLILCDKNDSSVQALSSTIRNYFTFRKCWAWMEGRNADEWGWLENYPQPLGYTMNGSTRVNEQITVSCAQHPATKIGKSYHDGSQPSIDQYALCSRTAYGDYVAEQWSRALATKPPVLMFTQWNEWVAQRFVISNTSQYSLVRPGATAAIGESYFIDAYNQEFNRDIEPAKNPLIRDNYYLQFVSYARQYRGVRSIMASQEGTTISLDGNMSQWSSIGPEFRDEPGDVYYTSWAAMDPDCLQRSSNDIKMSKVTSDRDYVYFYTSTVDNISSPSASDAGTWMQLFINTDHDYSSGWCGYDFRTGLDGSGNYCLYRSTSNSSYSWTSLGTVLYFVSGNQMYVAMPKSLLWLGDQITVDFKWADNVPANPDILDFIVNGDSAPNGRFNYRYKGHAGGLPVDITLGNGSNGLTLTEYTNQDGEKHYTTTATNGDPFTYTHPIGQAVNRANYPKISFEYAAPLATDLQIFFFSSSVGLSEAHSIHYSLPATSTDETYRTYQIDITPAYNFASNDGTIYWGTSDSQMRFDFGNVTGAKFNIRNIKILSLADDKSYRQRELTAGGSIVIEAEDYDLGGKGVGYDNRAGDTTCGSYRSDNEHATISNAISSACSNGYCLMNMGSDWNQYVNGTHTSGTNISNPMAIHNWGSWYEYTFSLREAMNVKMRVRHGVHFGSYGAIATYGAHLSYGKADGYTMPNMTEDWVKRYTGACAISIDGNRIYTTQTKRPRCTSTDATAYQTLLNTPANWSSTLWGNQAQTDTLYFYPNKANINTWNPYYHDDYDYVNVSLSAGRHTLRVTSLSSQWAFDCIELSNAPEAPADPTFSPAGGTYTNSVSVSISCATAGAEIHYTTDGTTPDANSPTYSSALTLTHTRTVKAVAIKNGLSSGVASATYTITDQPVIDPSQFVFTKMMETTDVPSRSDSHFSTGHNGYLYTTNRTGNQIIRYDLNGTRSVWHTVTNLASGIMWYGITSDDAGNILVEGGSSYGTDCWRKLVIIEPNGTEHAITLTQPEGVSGTTRADNLGRIVGNVMSYDGGWLYVVAGDQPKAFMYKFRNGNQQVDDLSPTMGITPDNTSVAQPSKWTVADIESSGRTTAFYARRRGNRAVHKWNDAKTAMVALDATPSPPGPCSTDGFDVFQLGGETFLVEASGPNNYRDGFTIRKMSDNSIVAQRAETLTSTASPTYQSLTARVSADGTYAYIYQTVGGYLSTIYRYGMPFEYAAAPTFSVPAGTYNEWKTVTITSATTDAVIHYSTDGVNYSTMANGGSVTLTDNCTLYAFATKTGYLNSAETFATYVIYARPTSAVDAASINLVYNAVIGKSSNNPTADLIRYDGTLTFNRPSSSGFYGWTLDSYIITISDGTNYAQNVSGANFNNLSISAGDNASVTIPARNFKVGSTYTASITAHYVKSGKDPYNVQATTKAAVLTAYTTYAPSMTVNTFVSPRQEHDVWWSDGSGQHKCYFDSYRIELTMSNPPATDIPVSYYQLQMSKDNGTTWINVTDRTLDNLLDPTENPAMTYPVGLGLIAGRYPGNYNFDANKIIVDAGTENEREISLPFYYLFDVTSRVAPLSYSDPTQDDPANWRYRLTAVYGAGENLTTSGGEPVTTDPTMIQYSDGSASSSPAADAMNAEIIITGVETVSAAQSDRNAVYYNLQGVRIDKPSAGQVVIRVETMSDGTLRTSKVVIR